MREQAGRAERVGEHAAHRALVPQLPQRDPRLERAGRRAANSSRADEGRRHGPGEALRSDRRPACGRAGVRRGPTPPAAAKPWITEGRRHDRRHRHRHVPGRTARQIEEYQDLRNGALSNIFFRGRDDRNWVDFYGENFGRDDTYMSLRGGRYDVFKYRAYTNWLPHNMAYGALTPFQGAGIVRR